MPFPISSRPPADSVPVYDTSEVTREYELSGDTLWTIISRIGDRTARSMLIFRLEDSDRRLSLFNPWTRYVHGNCNIERGAVDYLFRRD